MTPLLALGLPDEGMVLLLLIIALPLAFFWVTQFVQLMLLEDRLFPGKFDKAIWGAAFIVLWPLTPFAFRAWKSARLATQS
jgi:hypothetical protein